MGLVADVLRQLRDQHSDQPGVLAPPPPENLVDLLPVMESPWPDPGARRLTAI